MSTCSKRVAACRSKSSPVGPADGGAGAHGRPRSARADIMKEWGGSVPDGEKPLARGAPAGPEVAEEEWWLTTYQANFGS
jgi:hypothetical protein